MNIDQFFALFDKIADAPNAILRLRQFVLDLAVRGKLVPQDPNDEPASELVKQIEKEKVRLVKLGEIKKAKSLPSLEIDDMPFEIPQLWQWVPIRLITTDRGQKTPDNEFTYIDVSSINKESGIISEPQILSPEEAPSRARKIVQKGDVIYSCVRPYLLNIAVVDKEFSPEPIVSTAFAVLNSLDLISSRYLWLALRSSYFIGCVENKMRGQAYPAINDRDFAPLPISLPPLAEQHRIVAKVNELMALCDELVTEKNKRESRRDRLVASTLHRLDNGASDDTVSFTDRAKFYFNHLPQLTTRPEHIQQLRQTILNLAVRGKLVPQDPNDEPASELFCKIQGIKQELIESGKLKKDKKLWEGIQNTPAISLPSNWIWVRLQDIFEISRGGSPRPAGDTLYFGGNIPWITVGEITKDTLKFLTETELGLTVEGSQKSRFINIEDLLLTNSGATLGVPKISKIRGCINDGVAVLRLFHDFNLNDYAYEFLRSQTSTFRKVNQGVGQPNLNTPIIAAWYFPLPPLAEQHRIVAKVNELMALCDELEAGVIETTKARGQLLDVVLHEALAGERTGLFEERRQDAASGRAGKRGVGAQLETVY